MFFPLAMCLLACSSSPPRSEDTANVRSTIQRIEVRASTGDAIDNEVRVVRERANAAYPKIVSVLGAHRVPASALIIRLEGDAGPGRYSLVDPASGDIRLYRYPAEGYEASVVHEMIHALRRHLWTDPARQTGPFLFVEEGLAEIVAVEVGFPSLGFPLYGTPLAVAAGQWIARGEDLPIAELARRHRDFNFTCMPQAYGLRLSFMQFLRERHGLAPLLALAYSDAPLSEASFKTELGASLEELESSWRTWATAQYTNTPDAEAKALRYREETPIKHFPVCARDGSPAAR